MQQQPMFNLFMTVEKQEMKAMITPLVFVSEINYLQSNTLHS